MGEHKKRKVPSLLKVILDADIALSRMLVNFTQKCMPLRQLQVHSKALEISCHGIVWIVSIIASIWILYSAKLHQMQVNLLLGIILDILFVAVLKASTRRRRPTVNDDPFAIGPDKYSFPSGHASRSIFILYFFLYLWPIPTLFIPSIFAWSMAVCLSRLLMRRHHFLDVCAGMFLGFLEGIIMGYLYLESQTCTNLVAWISNDKIPGAEYDV